MRLLALVEIGLGGLLVVTGWWLAALTAAALYVGFAAFLAVGIRRGRLARGCGCLGASQGSATWSHVLVNLALAAVLVAAGTVGPALPLDALGLTAPLTLALVTTAIAGVASIRALFVGGDATLGSAPHDPSSELT